VVSFTYVILPPAEEARYPMDRRLNGLDDEKGKPLIFLGLDKSILFSFITYTKLEIWYKKNQPEL
jgi:hypothetical protein